MEIIELAKRFAKAGFYVFPIYQTDQGPKKPYGWARNEVSDEIDKSKVFPATTDVNEIDTWVDKVRKAYRSEICNYGVLGKGVIIIDIDIKNGHEGPESYEKLKAQFNIPAANLVVKSRSGGIHLYFAKSEKYKSSLIKTVSGLTIAKTKYDGIDIRGDGGMVIGPNSVGNWSLGEYTVIRGEPETVLSVAPDILTTSLLRSVAFTDIDAMTSAYTVSQQEDDTMSMLKRGEIPPKLTDGQRNEGYYLFVHALKNKGLSRVATRKLCESLKEVTENPETLVESVNLDDMIARAYEVDINNPYDVARDVIDHGFYQLLDYKGKLGYIIINPNPYTPSRNPHDISSMRTLFAKHSREMVVKEKKTVINPIDIITKIIPDTNRVDVMGFRPGRGDSYTEGIDSNGKVYLNLYQPPYVPKSNSEVDPVIYEEFCLLISRVFGDVGTEEYQLGLDFIAWHIQCPENKCVVAPYLMSQNRGVGKSLLFNVLAMIFGHNKIGERQAKMAKVDEITGRFFNPTGHLLNLIDEVQFPIHKDMRRESTTFWRHLKNLITAETVPVEFKGGGTYQLPNTASFILAGNTGGNFPMEEFDRRIWLIDNGAKVLERGIVDRLFDLTKGRMAIGIQRKLIHSLRYYLEHHQIMLDLDSIRAPMNDLKREMMLNSMTNEEEWFFTHFENPENVLSNTPIISKSALVYLFDTSDQVQRSKWRDDADGLFREMKRKGFIKSIKTKKGPMTSRQFAGVNQVSPLGDITEARFKELLFTTREHGSYDDHDTSGVLQAYNRNLHSIKVWKEELIRSRKTSSTPTVPNISDLSL